MTTTAPTDLDTLSQPPGETHIPPADGAEPTSRDQGSYETHRKAVAAPLDGSHEFSEAHSAPSAVTTLATGNHLACATQTKREAGSNPLGGDQRFLEAQSRDVTVEQAGTGPDAIGHSRPLLQARRGPFLYDPLLCLLADSLDDLEKLRIATDNRVRALTRTEADSDGEYRGLGLDARSPQVARVLAIADGITKLEHQATLDLRRQLRAHPINTWVQRQKGVGEKQAARLLASVGDPYWNDLHDRPRTVSELWAYCGYSVTDGRAQRRTKGVKANWNDDAKMRVHLMAESCMKSLGGDYRHVYDDARAQYAEATHPHDCVRCGPTGKPALAGTPLSLGHQHARALRRVAKQILKDLWLEARQLHTGETPA